MHKFVRNIIIFIFFPLVLGAISCSRTEPRIAFGFMELVYYQNEGKPEEKFSFFVIPEDEDGIENLEDLYLYHDREQLRWHLNSTDWVSYVHEGTTWIGSRAITIADDEQLPRGQFRAVLINKGGEKSERNFSFDAPEDSRFPFPSLEMGEGRYRVDSAYPVNRLICYDDQGNYISLVNLSRLSGSIDELGLPAEARTAALWAEDAQYFTSAITYVSAVR